MLFYYFLKNQVLYKSDLNLNIPVSIKSCNNIIECSWSENVYNAVKDIKLELFQPEDCILVKGSRHMKLEILVKHLIYKFKGK